MTLKRKRRIAKWKLIVLSTIASLILLAWLFYRYNVSPVLTKISEEKVRELTTIAVNNAAEWAIRENEYDYNSVVTPIKNDNGEIELLSVNSLLLNLISRRVASLSQSNISGFGTQGIDVPIGSLSGLTFLTGRGPNITLKVYPVGSVAIEFISELQPAGINQTKHKIKLLVTANVSVIMPGNDRSVSTKTEIPLCESVIVGKVPNTYLNMNRVLEPLNLTP